MFRRHTYTHRVGANDADGMSVGATVSMATDKACTASGATLWGVMGPPAGRPCCACMCSARWRGNTPDAAASSAPGVGGAGTKRSHTVQYERRADTSSASCCGASTDRKAGLVSTSSMMDLNRPPQTEAATHASNGHCGGHAVNHCPRKKRKSNTPDTSVEGRPLTPPPAVVALHHTLQRGTIRRFVSRLAACFTSGGIRAGTGTGTGACTSTEGSRLGAGLRRDSTGNHSAPVTC